MKPDVETADLTEIERAGYVNVHMKDAAGMYRFAFTESEALVRAWTQGAAFFVGLNCLGSQSVVKLALVEGVTVMSADAIARDLADGMEKRARERQRKLTEGEL